MLILRFTSCICKSSLGKQGVLWLLCLTILSSCLSREENFTQGRLEEICRTSVPICQTKVTCQMSDQNFVKGTFPGAERAMIYTPHPRSTLTLRFLLDKQVYPGTEFLVRTYQVACIEKEEENLKDIDIFKQAGQNRVLEFTFDLIGEGDHLIEWFADASARYTVTATLEYKLSEE
jgi:hypothetical protein